MGTAMAALPRMNARCRVRRRRRSLRPRRPRAGSGPIVTVFRPRQWASGIVSSEHRFKRHPRRTQCGAGVPYCRRRAKAISSVNSPYRTTERRDAPGPAIIWWRKALSASRSLTQSTGNSVLGFRFDWPASVAQAATRLFAYRPADVFGKSNQRLTGRAAAAFKGVVIGVE